MSRNRRLLRVTVAAAAVATAGFLAGPPPDDTFWDKIRAGADAQTDRDMVGPSGAVLADGRPWGGGGWWGDRDDD